MLIETLKIVAAFGFFALCVWLGVWLVGMNQRRENAAILRRRLMETREMARYELEGIERIRRIRG